MKKFFILLLLIINLTQVGAEEESQFSYNILFGVMDCIKTEAIGGAQTSVKGAPQKVRAFTNTSEICSEVRSMVAGLSESVNSVSMVNNLAGPFLVSISRDCKADTGAGRNSRFCKDIRDQLELKDVVPFSN